MKKLWNGSALACIAGIVVSIIIMIVGGSTYTRADEFFVASNMKFGADFYTEIFEEVEQVKASTRGIENAVYEVGGLLLISLGAIGVCFFGKPVLEIVVSKKEDKNDAIAEGPYEQMGQKDDSVL